MLAELNRRAGHRSIAAEDTAVTRLRLQWSVAADAIVEEQACVLPFLLSGRTLSAATLTE